MKKNKAGFASALFLKTIHYAGSKRIANKY